MTYPASPRPDDRELDLLGDLTPGHGCGLASAVTERYARFGSSTCQPPSRPPRAWPEMMDKGLRLVLASPFLGVPSKPRPGAWDLAGRDQP